MSEGLMTVEEAEERWPVDDYDNDTLGGMRREIIRKFWSIHNEITSNPEFAPEHAEILAAWESDFVRKEARIDDLQYEGLRTAWRSLMGTEFPVEGSQ